MRLRPATADDVVTVVGWIDSEAAMARFLLPANTVDPDSASE